MRLPIAQIDAFARQAFEGNPAAVMPLAGWLADHVLQKIAAENNLSETAFLVASDDAGEEGGADFDLRWFTPTVEVVMCGHATLASGHFVLSSDPDRERVRFRTRKAGMLEVARAGAIYELALPAWVPAPKDMPEIVAGLGIEHAVETLWHEHRYALIVLENADQVRALKPDFRVLMNDGDTMTIATAPGDSADVVSRVFVPGAGVDEDPVTGSAHSVLVPYWAARLGRTDAMTFFQASARGGHLTGRLDGDRVVLGGQCVTVIEGVMTI